MALAGGGNLFGGPDLFGNTQGNGSGNSFISDPNTAPIGGGPQMQNNNSFNTQGALQNVGWGQPQNNNTLSSTSNPYMPGGSAGNQNTNAGNTGSGGTTNGGGSGGSASTGGGTATPPPNYGPNSASGWGPGMAASGGASNGANPAPPANPYADFLKGIGNPYQQNVTAGTVDVTGAPSGTTSFGSNNPNYVTQAATDALGKQFGANTVSENMTGNWGPAGAPSAPQYGLDFGKGDIQDPGAVLANMQQGIAPWLVEARMKAGIAPPQLGTGVGPSGNSYGFWNNTPTTNVTGQKTVTGSTPQNLQQVGLPGATNPLDTPGSMAGLAQTNNAVQHNNSQYPPLKQPNNPLPPYPGGGQQQSPYLTGYSNYSNPYSNQGYYPSSEPNMRGGPSGYGVPNVYGGNLGSWGGQGGYGFNANGYSSNSMANNSSMPMGLGNTLMNPNVYYGGTGVYQNIPGNTGSILGQGNQNYSGGFPQMSPQDLSAIMAYYQNAGLQGPMNATAIANGNASRIPGMY